MNMRQLNQTITIMLKKISMDKQKIIYIVTSVLILSILMSFVDAVIRPTYFVKSVIKIILFAVVFLGYGSEIIVSGYKNMVHRTPNMDTLVTLGALTSFIYSICVMVFGNGHLYFETVIMIIYFVKLGRFVEGQVKDKTKEAMFELKDTLNKIAEDTAYFSIKSASVLS